MSYFSPRRLYANWVYGGFLAGLLLLGLLPVLSRGWTFAMVCVFLQLPIYMLHQYEEHDAGRFREFANEVVGKGRELFTDRSIFFINIFGVWAVNMVSITLAFTADIGFGLIGVYLPLVNALAHVGQALKLKRYNPGLVSALVLFFPLSGLGLWVVSRSAGWPYHAVGLLSALAIHALIIAYARWKKSHP